MTESAAEQAARWRRDVLAHLPGLVYRIEIGEDRRTVFLNDKVESLTGYPIEALTGGAVCPLDALIVAEDRPGVAAEVDAAIRERRPFHIRYRIRHRSGRIRHLLDMGSAACGGDGATTFIDGLVADDTEHAQGEEALRARDDRFEKLSGHVPGMIYQFMRRPDGTYCVPFTTGAVEGIFGCAPEDIREDFAPIFRVIWPEDRDRVIGSIEASAEAMTTWLCEYRVQIPGGPVRWLLGHSTPERLPDGSVLWHGFNTDITERKQVEQTLRESERRYRELSIVDDLTGLYNSRHFYGQLKMEIDRANRYGHPLTLLMLDLDDFKRFNDVYGHIEGDHVLSRLGLVVRRCLRQTDSAYRYGGEEFTILLPMTRSEDGGVTAERIREEFGKEVFSPVPDRQVSMTVSIGLGQYGPKEDLKSFIHRVDQWMYRAKQAGKDRVCSDNSHHGRGEG